MGIRLNIVLGRFNRIEEIYLIFKRKLFRISGANSIFARIWHIFCRNLIQIFQKFETNLVRIWREKIGLKKSADKFSSEKYGKFDKHIKILGKSLEWKFEDFTRTVVPSRANDWFLGVVCDKFDVEILNLYDFNYFL